MTGLFISILAHSNKFATKADEVNTLGGFWHRHTTVDQMGCSGKPNECIRAEIVAGALQDYGRALILEDSDLWAKAQFQVFTRSRTRATY